MCESLGERRMVANGCAKREGWSVGAEVSRGGGAVGSGDDLGEFPDAIPSCGL